MWLHIFYWCSFPKTSPSLVVVRPPGSEQFEVCHERPTVWGGPTSSTIENAWLDSSAHTLGVPKIRYIVNQLQIRWKRRSQTQQILAICKTASKSRTWPTQLNGTLTGQSGPELLTPFHPIPSQPVPKLFHRTGSDMPSRESMLFNGQLTNRPGGPWDPNQRGHFGSNLPRELPCESQKIIRKWVKSWHPNSVELGKSWKIHKMSWLFWTTSSLGWIDRCLRLPATSPCCCPCPAWEVSPGKISLQTWTWSWSLTS